MSAAGSMGVLSKKVFRVSADVEIAVHEAGQGPAIVFIHGSGPGASGPSNFRTNLPAFAAAGYRVVAPDLVGYGQSSKPTERDYTLEFFTETLLSALDQAEVGSVTLVGNSLGGAIAIDIALARPEQVERLILMAPGGVETRDTYFAMPGIAKMVGDFTNPEFTQADQRRLITNLVYDASVVTDDLVAERYAVAKTQPKDVLARMRVPDLSPRLSELKMPILGFWGAEDAFCPPSGAQKFLQACDNARFMLFNKVGHWVMVERAEEFNRYALDFLRS